MDILRKCEELKFSDVCFNTKGKKILKHVSGSAKRGDMLAIIGPSGSGKTTLLHTIAGRLNVTSGAITLNGYPLNKENRRRLGYVMQDDVFLSNLTLWETLYFSAMIRISDSISKQEKLDRIQKLVAALDLQHCLNTPIGDVFRRGLSGGERKRTHIACEMLTNPDIFLVDEPTSGLDSSTAYKLMKQLKAYSTDNHKTLVVTIHQPSSKVYHMFSTLLMLVEGQSAYYGLASEATTHFTRLGYPYNPMFNPADYLLELLTSDEIAARIINAKTTHPSSHQNDTYNTDIDSYDMGLENRMESEDNSMTPSIGVATDESQTARWPTSSWNQLKLLNWRSYKQAKGAIFHKYDVVLEIWMAIAWSVMFFQIEETRVRDKMGLVTIVFLQVAFRVSVVTVLSYSTDRKVVWKERTLGAYRLSMFYLSKLTSELPLILVIPILFYTAMYWATGLGGVDGWLVFCGIGILNCLLVQSVACLVGISFINIKISFRLMDACLLGGVLAGGFYNIHPPTWFAWSKYISIIHYPYAATMSYILKDMESIRCNETSLSRYPQCRDGSAVYLESRDILDAVGIELPIYCYITTIVLVTCSLHVLAYFILRLKRQRY